MGFVPVMWAVWGVSFVFMVAVAIFSARLGRNEEAQICLADSSSHVKDEQAEIAARLNRVQPVKRIALAIVGVMTVVVVGYYILDIFHQF